MKMEYVLVFLIFFPFAAGLFSFAAGKARDMVAIASVVIESAAFVWLAVSLLSDSAAGFAGEAIGLSFPGVCGLGIHFRLDGFRLIYSGITAFMWMMTTILSREYFKHHNHVNRFYLFLLWTLGATMGVFLSADLYTMFIFFEIMSFTSYAWVAQEENRPSLRAAETYLAVAVMGGLVMLMGIFLLYHLAGELGLYIPGQPLYFEELKSLCQRVAQMEGGSSLVCRLWVSGCCMLFGFGAKAGAFPLHIWLPKAHPVAPAPASALLSGILTKTGVFGILILSCQLFLRNAAWGGLILGIGVITMFGGALLAIFSIDLKRTLACSSMSQIGFILVGIGMLGLLGEKNALAVHGTVLHMVNHSLIKLVLFMAAGVVYMNVHTLDLNEIRGFGRRKPLLKGIFLTGALAIGGIPLFGGYVSKTLLHEAIAEYGGGGLMTAVEWIFLFSGGLTVAYMTKLFMALFVEKNAEAVRQEKYDGMKRYMNPGSTFALTGSAVILLVWGLLPHRIMDRAAELAQSFLNLEETGHTVNYFSAANLRGGLISIGIGVLVYLLFVRRVLMRKEAGTGNRVYVNRWPGWLDLEELLYRPLLLRILPVVFGVICRVFDSLTDMAAVALRKTIYRDSPLPHEREEGNILTVLLGSILNGVQAIANHTWRRKSPVHKNYLHIMAVKNEEFRENNRIIARSLSSGLLLFCIGLALTLIYLIWW